MKVLLIIFIIVIVAFFIFSIICAMVLGKRADEVDSERRMKDGEKENPIN